MKNSQIVLAIGAIAASFGFYSCMNSEAKKGTGIDPANFDSTYSPATDFFHFANGGWIKKNPIPSDQVRWGTFSILSENNKKNLHAIVDEAAAKTDAAKGSPEQLVGDFYYSAMDTNTIE